MTSTAASVFGIALAILSNSEGLGSNYESSAVGVALILFFTNMPGLFFSIFAGVGADWYNRKKIMFATSIIRFGLAMIFVVFKGWDSSFIAYSIVFLKSGVTQIYMPSQASVIPDIIKKKNIMLANSVINLTNYSTYFLGVVGAGTFIRIFGEEHTFTVLGAMFLVGAALIPFIRVPKRETPSISFSTFLSGIMQVLVSLKEAMKYIWNGKVQRFAMIHNFLTTSVLFIIISIIFKLANFLIKVDARDVGIVTMLPLIIGVLGSMVYLNTFAKNSKRVATIHNGVILAAFAFVTITILTLVRFNADSIVASYNLPMSIDSLIWGGTLFGLMIIGLCFPLLIIPAQTLIHEDTERNIRGRVFGIWFAINQAIATIPAIIISVLADSSLGIPTTATLLSIGIIMYAIILIPFRKLA